MHRSLSQCIMFFVGSGSESGLSNHVGARDEFFDVVRRRLADVPWPKRQMLLEEVTVRLGALPRQSRPEDVLGDPRSYAQLIREAEGLSAHRTPRFPYWRAMRLRNKVLLITVPLLLGLGSGANTYVHHYQPLKASSDIASSTAPMIDDPLAQGVNFYSYQRGATVVTGIGVTNTGWTTATVTGAVMADGSPFSFVGLRSQSDSHLIGLWKQATPVDRVVVHPGESIEVFVVMKMKPYQLSPQGSVVVDQPPLVVEVLGVTHEIRPSGSKIGVAG